MLQNFNQYHLLVQNTFFQLGVMDLASKVPLLIINGYAWSIAGLIIPICFTGYLLLFKNVEFDNKITRAIIFSWFMNFLLIFYQAYHNFPGDGIHLFSLVYFIPIMELMIAYYKKENIQLPNVEVLIVATFISMLPCDMLGAVWMWIRTPHHPPIIESFTWVGGAGWMDGLLLGMLSSILIWAYSYFLYKKEENQNLIIETDEIKS
jgi:hypothetical protein